MSKLASQHPPNEGKEPSLEEVATKSSWHLPRDLILLAIFLLNVAVVVGAVFDIRLTLNESLTLRISYAENKFYT